MNFVEIYIMGKKYRVPAELTVQKAMEYSGFQIIRGCGCRGGVCGACAMIYRIGNGVEIKTGLACITQVQEEMMILNLPYYPARKVIYDMDKLTPTAETAIELYPEVLRCMGCNACTQICPQDIEVMNMIAEVLSGDIQKAGELSAECVMCGLCAAKCPAGLSPHHVALLCRRLYGKHMLPAYSHVINRLEALDNGEYDAEMDQVLKLDSEGLKEEYKKSMADRRLV